jgi:hypothetical protein
MHTYGGRDASEDEEAEEWRVQGAVGVDDPEHRPLARVLEDGPDLRRRALRSVKEGSELGFSQRRAKKENEGRNAPRRWR